MTSTMDDVNMTYSVMKNSSWDVLAPDGDSKPLTFEVPTHTAHNCFNSTSSDMGSPISIHGGFIAMAAGLSVVVPLVCVLIIQLRKARREERLRREREVAAVVNDAPPSYDQLFGDGCETSRPLHSRTGSTDGLMEEGRSGVSGGGHENMAVLETLGSETDGLRTLSTHARLVFPDILPAVMETTANDSRTPQTTLAGSNQRNASSSAESINTISTISGSEVADVPRTVFAQSSSSTVSTATTIATSQSGRTNSSSSTSGQSPPSSSTSSSSSTTGTANNRQSEVVSIPDPTPSGQAPPSYAPWRRLPGMHISIHDFFTNLMGGNTTSGAEQPPPTYEEALKILEKAKIAQEQFDRSKKL